MGNIAEHGGFGDTRVPSDDEELSAVDYRTVQELRFKQLKDEHQFTYRNGVNYIREDAESEASRAASRQQK